MTHKLFIAALLFAAFVSPICAPAEERPTSAPLGRLFFSPSQRAELDRARHAPPVSPPRAAALVALKRVAPPPMPTSETVTVNGIVQRSDGQATVWINSRPVSDQDESASAITGHGEGGQITLQIPESTRRLQLKVGQRADLRTGEIRERFSEVDATVSAGSEDVEAVRPQPERISQARRSVPHRPNGPDRLGGTYE